MEKTTSWLWPDHVIGKRESRRLREEHNALVNRCASLHATLTDLRDQVVRYSNSDDCDLPDVSEADAILNP